MRASFTCESRRQGQLRSQASQRSRIASASSQGQVKGVHDGLVLGAR